MRDHFNRTSFLFALSCWSIIFSLYLVEIVLWIIEPSISKPLNGEYAGRSYTWGHKVVVNRFGFREREFDVPKPPGTWRVMVLGDSLTWGAGLSIEQRYSNILEHLLQLRFPEHRIEVLNFGVSGGPTTLEKDIAQKYFDLVGPDLVVLGFCINDPQPRRQDWSVERENLENTSTMIFVRAGLSSMHTLKLSRISDRLERYLLRKLEIANLLPPWQVALNRTYDRESPEWRDFVSALRSIFELSKRRGLPSPIFAVLNQALDNGIAEDYSIFKEHQYFLWYRQAAEAALREGFDVIDFVQDIKNLPSTASLTVNPFDGHPSAKLNEVYSWKIFEAAVPKMLSKKLNDGTP